MPIIDNQSEPGAWADQIAATGAYPALREGHAPLETRHRQARTLLAEALDCLDQMIADQGKCDHSVGICYCADERLAERIREFLHPGEPA